MEDLTKGGLTPESAKAYMFIQRYMVEGHIYKDMDAGIDFNPDGKEDIFERMVVLPEFFQGLSDVMLAITNKKIEPRLEDVKKELPLLARRVFHKNAWKFHTAVNELKNIAAGMSTF